MSVAWYNVLEREIPGFDHGVNGKALGRAAETLDALADELGVQRLMQFFSAPPEDLIAFGEGQGIDLEESPMNLPSEKWFAAELGLKTVDALMVAVADRKIEPANPILDDLKEFQNVLNAARENGVRWHLAVDF